MRRRYKYVPEPAIALSRAIALADNGRRQEKTLRHLWTACQGSDDGGQNALLQFSIQLSDIIARNLQHNLSRSAVSPRSRTVNKALEAELVEAYAPDSARSILERAKARFAPWVQAAEPASAFALARRLRERPKETSSALRRERPRAAICQNEAFLPAFRRLSEPGAFKASEHALAAFAHALDYDSAWLLLRLGAAARPGAASEGLHRLLSIGRSFEGDPLDHPAAFYLALGANPLFSSALPGQPSSRKISCMDLACRFSDTVATAFLLASGAELPHEPRGAEPSALAIAGTSSIFGYASTRHQAIKAMSLAEEARRIELACAPARGIRRRPL